MKKCPVQVVLRTDDFIVSNVKLAGGSTKDFYAGKDQAFVKHKNALLSQLEAIRTIQSNSKYSKICYAKVLLKPSALAKSHRPTRVLFNDRVTSLVGGGELGEIYLEFRKNSVESVVRKLANVETETRWTDLNDKKKSKPSRLRSEVGGISEIRPFSASDKRRFSVDEGLAWLSDLRTGGSYVVELFEEIPPRQNWENVDQDKRSLFESFLNGIHLISADIILSSLSDSKSMANMITVKVVEKKNSNEFASHMHISSYNRGASSESVSLDKDVHIKLIKFLEDHPLVRKISLPSIVNAGSVNKKTLYRNQASLPASNAETDYPKIGIVDGGVSLALEEIAEENDVNFVISAGNTDEIDRRWEWPENKTAVHQIIATSNNDTKKSPAESSKNICVSALNSSNLDGILALALGDYSCRGPSIRVGVKPNLSHVGGSGSEVLDKVHGLYSIDTDGEKIDICGTNFASPLVAKTLAMNNLERL